MAKRSLNTTTARGETDDEAQAKGLATWIVSRGDRTVEIRRALDVTTMNWLVRRTGGPRRSVVVRSADFAAVHARAVAMLEGGR